MITIESERRGAAGRRAIEVVERFLAALEARDLATASALLAAGARLRFPGPQAAFGSLEELVAWSRTRYRSVRKRIERHEALEASPSDGGGGVTVVYCLGTLAGEWPDAGRGSFDGIRFIDRFEIDAEGRIRDQQVWNDLAEFRKEGVR